MSANALSSAAHSAPLTALLYDLGQPDMPGQIGLLLACLLLALIPDRLLRRRAAAHEGLRKLGLGALQRLAFPLTALALLTLARLIAAPYMHVRILAIAASLLAALAVIRAVFYVLRHSFAAAAWLANFERGFALTVWSVAALHLTGLLPELIELLEAISFTIGKQKLDLWQILQGIGMLFTTLILALWLGGLLEARLMAAAGLDANLKAVFSRLLRALLIVLAVLIGLPLVGIDLTTLSVFGGALGVGLGFGLQKIAANYVSGFILLLDRSIRIGDLISVGNERGQVSQITTRYTVLKGLTGLEAIVPNEVLVGSVVLNETYTDSQVRLALPVQVAYGTDLEQALALLVEAGKGQERVLTDPPPKAFVVRFADSGIDLELGVWVADPQNGSLAVRSAINLAIWRSFRQHGIQIPFPQREVRLLAER